MRAAVLLTLALTAPIGCAKQPADAAPAEPVSGAATDGKAQPAGNVELWKLVKIELPTPGGACVEEVAATEVAILKAAGPGKHPGRAELPARQAEFSHEHHTGTLGIDCRYCHSAAAQGVAREQRVKVCMNCHQQIVQPAASDRVTTAGMKGSRWTFTATRDATKSPKEIDLTECDADGNPLPGRVARRGIYEEDGDRLRIALTFGDVPADYRPREFKPAFLPRAGGKTGFAGVAVFELKK